MRLPAATIPRSRLSVSFDIAFTARPGAYRSVASLLEAFAPDVIHQHGQFFDLTWLTGWWARRHDVPVLLSVHTRLENPTAAYRGVFRSLDALLVRPALRAYRPRVVVMDALMQDYITSRYAGAYAGLEHIPVGVDPDGGRSAGTAPGSATGTTSATRRWCSASGTSSRCATGWPSSRRCRRCCGGTRTPACSWSGGSTTTSSCERARELGVSHAVLAVGAVARADVPDHLAAADVEAHDLQGYGLGTASLESMAAGVPVVAAVRPDNFPGVRLVSGQGPRPGARRGRRRARRRGRRPAGRPGPPGAHRGGRAAAGPRAVLPRRGAGPAPRGAGPDGRPHDRPVTVGARRPPRHPPGVRAACLHGVDHPVAGQDAGPLDLGVGASPAGQGDEAVQLGGQRLPAGHQLRDLDDRLLPCTSCPARAGSSTTWW